MNLRIREVKDCKNKAMGNYLLLGHGSALITISLKRNQLLAEYMATMYHELMHLYFTLARKKGFRVTDRLEHIMIYEMEAASVRVMRRYFKNGKRIR
jgi:hypothetical protein